jgi:hypothetical protein
MQALVCTHPNMLLVPTALSANFLYQNYRQVLQILENEEYAVSIVEHSASCNHQDSLQFLQEECLYLNNLNSLNADPPELTAQIEYANALKQYYETK